MLEQNATAYDPAGNVIEQTQRQRLDNASGFGRLQDVNTEPKARVSYAAVWPDAIGRPQNSADFGTNGSEPLVRPDIAPARSDTVLVTTNRYKDNGDANAVIDPEGLETRWENDQLGRRLRLIENFVMGCADQSRVSEYIWHPSGQLQRLTLVNSVTGNQVTCWVFGTTLIDSAVANNNLLRAKIYPESDDRPAPLDAGPDGIYCREEYTYNRQGQGTTFKNADETVRAYAYDKLGRLLNDSITVLADGLSSAVLRIKRAYEVRGMLQTVSSFDALSGGSIVKQVVLGYDAFSNLISDQQSHSGAVDGSTPKVRYACSDGSNNTMRRVSLTYPNGRVVDYIYGAADSINDHLNRVSALQVEGEGAQLADYTYCGVAWQVRVGYPQPNVELTYKKQAGEPVGDSGDPYNGYDRFGRTQDIRWQTPES